MSGISIMLKSIDYDNENYYIDPEYINHKSFDLTKTGWKIVSKIDGEKNNRDWDLVTITTRVSLYESDGEKLIAALNIICEYSVQTGLSFESKKQLVEILLPCIIAHIQGGWLVKHGEVNNLIANHLPPVTEYPENDMLALKKMIYDRWE